MLPPPGKSAVPNGDVVPPVAEVKLPNAPTPELPDASNPPEGSVPPELDISLGRKGTLTIEDLNDAVPIQIEESRVGPRVAPPIIVNPLIPAKLERLNQETPAEEKPLPPKIEPVQQSDSEDMTTLTGQVQMWRKTIRLRYAPIDQEDPYGGFAVLQGNVKIARLREGQRMRVRGILIPPENRNRAAHFKVQAIEILD